MTVRDVLNSMNEGNLIVEISNYYNGVPMEMIFRVYSYNSCKEFYEESRGNILSEEVKEFVTLKEFFNNKNGSIIANSDSICVRI